MQQILELGDQNRIQSPTILRNIRNGLDSLYLQWRNVVRVRGMVNQPRQSKWFKHAVCPVIEFIHFR